MKIIEIPFFVIMLFTITGCSKESLSPQDGSQQTLSLKVETPSAAAESDEDLISDARIIALRDANTLDANSGMKTIPAGGGSITQTVTTGTREIYVFANESQVQGMTAQLDNVRTLSALQAIQVPYSVDIAPPFLSSVMETKTLTDNTSMTANVERIVSKVVLTIKYEWETPDTEDLGSLTIDRVQVKNLPKYSYLIAKNYSEANDVDSKVIEGADLDDISADRYTYQSKPLTIYIPEFLGATDAAGRHAYLEIVGHLNSNPAITSTYRMPLSSNMAADGTITGTNYDIARNTAFTIDATIKDFGGLNNIEIGSEIEAWQTVNSTPEDVGHYVFLESVTADGVTIADGSNLHDMGTKLKVTCKTNIGGWYTVTRDMDNNIIDKSSPTESVTSGAPSQSVEIDIPKLAELTYGQNYTISIYQSNIAPEESVGRPVKVLKFTQYGGFIPNSLLSAEGWPANPERKKGLQIAKRGNKKLPSGVAETDDPTMWWKTSHTLTAGGVELISDLTTAKLGMGKSSTDAMVATPDLAAAHPAANYCREMGPEWYLPSIAELKLIYNNMVYLGTSYSYPPRTNYWSATEQLMAYSFCMTVAGTVINTGKISLLQVRCVREI